MNGSTTTVNGGAVNGTSGTLNGIGAAPRTATLGTPSSYAYTSTGSLLGRGGAARPVPPPTLPKYSGSFSAGSSTGLRERDREGTGGSHRLASLERLALRQRIIEHNANNQVSSLSSFSSITSNGGITSATVTLTDTATLQSKRELFFKSETVSSGGVSTTGPPSAAPPAPPLAPSALKDALAKRSATLPEPHESNHHEPNGTAATAKLTNSASIDVAKTNNAVPPATPAPPVPNSAPPAAPPLLRSTDNIKKPDHPPVAPKPELPKLEKPKTKELDGYVGFANLPNQVYRKAVKKGFEFTLMVVGETGLGKSTLINSLFLTDVYDKDKHPGPSLRVKKTVGVETSVVLLKENGVNLTLTIVDTPGFGDAVDNSNCWQPIIDFVESKYEEYLNAESRVTRKAALQDTRVHCCLYFIAPSGHGLKPLDVEFMQRLGDKVNIIPVIAKADTMTPEECKDFKEQIMKEITQHKIKIYDFPESTGEEGDGAEATRVLRRRVPFAVVGANTIIEQDGRRIRGRKYPWGIAEVENLEHCDFIALRNMVIRTHLQDLKDVTSSVHYENYRCRKLSGLTHDGKPHRINSNKNPLAQMEEEKREHDLKMKNMESEMEKVFEMKVREKRAKLKESETELARRHEATRRALEAQARELEERQRALDAERTAWERDTGLSLDDLRRRSLEANSKETVDGKDKKDKKKKDWSFKSVASGIVL
ncbi:septin-7 isoform X2 [Hyposmocoma kahamanoa]|uniref:septin-7 isoform X2 n=1 Tax=Hyposmocoma kahamanoa TaxID=1477025 RepID=UPI000E6D5E9B|nr:septin-7 isoform X2 [Hyposmocoma kahamanoa]